jgi:putative transposase
VVLAGRSFGVSNKSAYHGAALERTETATLAPLCREFDVSRKTGYKIFQRYKDCGLEGLTDRSRRPYRQANRLPSLVQTLIVRLKP